jgi:hypothetical protein
MAIAARLTSDLLNGWLPGNTEWLRIVRVSCSIAVGLVTLAAAAKIFRVEEFDEVWQRLFRRIFPQRAS